MGLRDEMAKLAASKAFVLKINLTFIAIFLGVYTTLLFQPSWISGETVPALTPCSTCRITEGKAGGNGVINPVNRGAWRKKIPSFMSKLGAGARVGLVNIGEDEAANWGERAVRVEFERVPRSLDWEDLFPEWIEEEMEKQACPEIPMPDFSMYEEVAAVAARVPCRRPEEGWARDVWRLQVHLVAANFAARRGRRKGTVTVAVAVEGRGCWPMAELLPCDYLVGREGEWWVYEVEARWFEEKVQMPVGSCKFALPFSGQQGTNHVPQAIARLPEAYATVIHSSDLYVCGAIALAQSILKAGTTRDLVLLHDKSISAPKLAALAAAGWKLRKIKRIRNPRAAKYSYNEYNYSKLRLWQLTEYRKVIFIDADIIALRSLDPLFGFPQISAVGNDGVIFNSGVMVMEPSNCTFRKLMSMRNDIVSYNGGDQGFLNEAFVWWHRLPRRANFLKNFWSNTTGEVREKEALFAADPPELYTIHYLGLKPWLCYRDYDCNWNLGDHRLFASDVAHRQWWRVHDEMEEGLQRFCELSTEQKNGLERDRRAAEKLGVGDGRWKIKIKDKRKKRN